MAVIHIDWTTKNVIKDADRIEYIFHHIKLRKNSVLKYSVLSQNRQGLVKDVFLRVEESKQRAEHAIKPHKISSEMQSPPFPIF